MSHRAISLPARSRIFRAILLGIAATRGERRYRGFARLRPHRENWSEVGVPVGVRHLPWTALSRAREKLMAANSVRCPRDRGKV